MKGYLVSVNDGNALFFWVESNILQEDNCAYRRRTKKKEEERRIRTTNKSTRSQETVGGKRDKPDAGSAHADSTSEPTQSFKKVTSLIAIYKR